MRGNWLRLGPLTIRVGSRHLAPWGFPRLQVGGLGVWSRDSGGGLVLASYHPKGLLTWHWSVRLFPGRPVRTVAFSDRRRGQWHDYVRLPFGWSLCVSRQDYHRAAAPGRTRPSVG